MNGRAVLLQIAFKTHQVVVLINHGRRANRITSHQKHSLKILWEKCGKKFCSQITGHFIKGLHTAKTGMGIQIRAENNTGNFTLIDFIYKIGRLVGINTQGNQSVNFMEMSLRKR